MVDTSLLLAGLIHGFMFSFLFITWKKLASRWSSWFPLLQTTAKYGLIGVFIFSVLKFLGYIMDVSGTDVPSSSAGLSILLFLIGLLGPSSFVKYKLGLFAADEIKRGTSVVSTAELVKKIKFTKKPTRLKIGPVPLPFHLEPYHLLISGATGTGKSVLINQLLTQCRAHGDTVIVVDSGGDFLSKHFHADSDFIFNPFDNRCINWSPTAEMKSDWDADSLAQSIVPDGIGESKDWNAYTQTFISGVLQRLYLSNRLSLKDFLYMVQIAPITELREFLKGTPAAAHLSSERTFASIRTIATTYVNAYNYLPNLEGEASFSVSDMISAEHSGFLYLTYRDDQLNSLRSLLGCILDIASRSILSLSPDPNRRIWLIIDEFASIGKVQSIEAVATKARKMGGCLVVGLQSISQLKDRYGDFAAQTILSCLSSWVVLRCTDAETADYMSRYIGETEVLRHLKGQSNSDSGDSSNKNEQQALQRAVLPSQLQSLENLTGFLRLADGFPIADFKLELPSRRLESVTAAFEPRDTVAKPMISFAEQPSTSKTTSLTSEAKIVSSKKKSFNVEDASKSNESKEVDAYLKSMPKGTKVLLARTPSKSNDK